jgi:FkbM family methyltransferase
MKRNSYQYYSQHGEDFLLWNFFNYKESGFYVDVGAFDGIHLSNTFSFEQQGWQGICIEPHPSYFPLCKHSRPKSICLNVACVGNDESKSVDFHVETSGLYSGILGDREDDITYNYKHGWGTEFTGLQRITVAACTLNAILTEHVPPGTEIAFISIDVEGTELDVLQGLDLSRFGPRVLLVEANTEETGKDITRYLEQFGYMEARQLRINRFYVRTLKDAEAFQAIEIGYRGEKSIHPLGERYTLRPFKRVEYRSERLMYIEELKKQSEQLKKQSELLRHYKEERAKYVLQLKQRDQQIEQKDQNIHEILNSHSYKSGRIIVYPFSVLKRLFKKLKNILVH